MSSFTDFVSSFVYSSPVEDAMPSTLCIISKDVDLTKFTESNVVKMREKYPGQSDDILARYLISKNNDYDQACTQLDRALAWRAAHFPILKSSCLKEINSGKLYIRGIDKEGRPLLIYRSRCVFPKETDFEECARMNIWFSEHLMRIMPKNMTKYTLIVDRTDHTSENTDNELTKMLSAQLQELFPETLGRAIIYPADVVFYSVWAVLKYFVDPVMRAKVQPLMYLSEVEEFIDREHIPKCMGGDDDYEYSPDHFEDPYSPEELAQAAAEASAARAATTGATSATSSVGTEGTAKGAGAGAACS